MRWRVVAIISLFGFLSLSTPATAITIVGNYIPSATGADNDPASGGGNIETVFEAAADHGSSPSWTMPPS